MPKKWCLNKWSITLLIIIIFILRQKAVADIVTFDFESGDLQGWTVAEGAFGKPVSDLDTQRNSPQIKYNKHGNYYLSTLELPGRNCDDGQTGVLESPVFVLEGANISFLIGGGDGTDTSVALCVMDGKIIRQAHGNNSETMNRVEWNVQEFIGQPVYLTIIDQSKGSWGHVTFDDFKAEGHIDEQSAKKLTATYRQRSENRIQQEKETAITQEKQLKQRAAQLLSDDDLFSRGQTRVYSGKYLDAIRLPLGGIGTGCIQINGRGEREIWQIFNNFCNVFVPNSFFAIRAEAKNSSPVVRVLQTRGIGPFSPMGRLTFRGEYPFGWYDFIDDAVPVKVSMETFNPLIPFNLKDSGIPCAIFNITVSNPTDVPIKVSLLATQQNPVGFMCPGLVTCPEPTDGIVFADFEGSDYGDWTVTGDAFGNQPCLGISSDKQKLTGFKGKKLANSFSNGGDAAKGTLKSPVFTISRDYINFVIAGGNYEGKTCINLLVDKQIVRTLAGPGHDDMHWRSWDVRDLKGKQAFIEIVDDVGETDEKFKPGETLSFTQFTNGHIEIDNIVFSDENHKNFIHKVTGLGQNQNQIFHDADDTVLYLSSERKRYQANPEQAEQICTLNGVDKSRYDWGLGNMALMALSKDSQATASWQNLPSLYQNWIASDTLNERQESEPSQQGQTYNGALAVPMTLAPSQSRTITFILAWHFPYAVHGVNWAQYKGNKYTEWWSDSKDTARYVKEQLKSLTEQTRLYHDTFYQSNLPQWLLDRISSQTAVLKSKTFFWAADNYIGCWEGCLPMEGSCFGNCSHVYHYAQSHARLFPSLARKLREQKFSYQRADGFISNRDPGEQEAIDAMCGEILGTYREYMTSDSRQWIDRNWNHVKNAMNYIIRRWDADEDGWLSGMQHNTLDTELTGCSSWLGSLYLSALAASEKLAEQQLEPELAKRYQAIRTSGAQMQNNRLWNDDYYIQIPQSNLQGHNYITGCHIDQVLGEWWAKQLGLDGHYPYQRVQSAMRALLRNNFRYNFAGIGQGYVAADDAGMQMICWPNPWDRPINPMFYSEQVMTGFEYAAAATMVQFGLLREGFMVAKAVHTRYDGRLREISTHPIWGNWGYTGNPFGDDECGKFYGRAMSNWSMLLACQGFIYDGPAGIIGFRPVWQPSDHRSFFTTAEGYGLFTQTRKEKIQTASLNISSGKLEISTLILDAADQNVPKKVTVMLDGKQVDTSWKIHNNDIIIEFPKRLTINQNMDLKAEIQF